jgi:hypothetical protein
MLVMYLNEKESFSLKRVLDVVYGFQNGVAISPVILNSCHRRSSKAVYVRPYGADFRRIDANCIAAVIGELRHSHFPFEKMCSC